MAKFLGPYTIYRKDQIFCYRPTLKKTAFIRILQGESKLGFGLCIVSDDI